MMGFIFCLSFVSIHPITQKTERFEVIITITDSEGEGKKDIIGLYVDYQGDVIESHHLCVMYDQRCCVFINGRAKNRTRFKIQVTMGAKIFGHYNVVTQEVLKGFGINPICTSAYNSFIQQLE